MVENGQVVGDHAACADGWGGVLVQFEVRQRVDRGGEFKQVLTGPGVGGGAAVCLDSVDQAGGYTGADIDDYRDGFRFPSRDNRQGPGIGGRAAAGSRGGGDQGHSGREGVCDEHIQGIGGTGVADHDLVGEGFAGHSRAGIGGLGYGQVSLLVHDGGLVIPVVSGNAVWVGSLDAGVVEQVVDLAAVDVNHDGYIDHFIHKHIAQGAGDALAAGGAGFVCLGADEGDA